MSLDSFIISVLRGQTALSWGVGDLAFVFSLVQITLLIPSFYDV